MSDFILTSVAFDPDKVMTEQIIRLPRLVCVEPKEMSDLENYAAVLVLDQNDKYHIISYSAAVKAELFDKAIPKISNKKLLDKVNISKMEILEYV